MRGLRLLLLLAGLALALPPAVEGKSQIRDRGIDYLVFETDHFEVFFTSRTVEGRVRTAAAWAEAQYARLRDAFAFDPVEVRGQKIPLFLYRSLHEFHQWPVGDVEGALGVTHFFQDRVGLPLLASPSFTKEVLDHELMHAFQVARYIPDARVGWSLIKMGIDLPFWFVEGGADHQAIRWNATYEMFLREGFLSDQIRRMSHLAGTAHLNPHEVVLRYKQGALFLTFLQERYGPESIRRLFHIYAGVHIADEALLESFGKSLGELDAEFRTWALTRYRAQARARATLAEAGRLLTHPAGTYWTWHRESAVSPDGNRVAFLHDPRQRLRLSVLSRDAPGAAGTGAAGTGAVRTLAKFPNRLRRMEGPTPSSGSRHEEGRALAWSPDGAMIAFLAEWRNDTGLILLDAQDGGVRRRVALPFDEAFSPAWTPDGRSIVLAGMTAGATDLHLLDLASGRWTRLTDDPHHDNAPAVRPDGKAVAYVSERAGQRDLFLLSLEDGTTTRLTRTASEELSPAWMPDGGSIVYTCDADGGIHDLWIHDVANGRRAPVTRVRGGAFTPCPIEGGARLVFAGYEASQYQVCETEIPGDLTWQDLPQDAPEETSEPVWDDGAAAPYATDWHLDSIFPLGPSVLVSFSDRTGRHTVAPFAAASSDLAGSSYAQGGVEYRNTTMTDTWAASAGAWHEARPSQAARDAGRTWTNRRVAFADVGVSRPLTPYLEGSLGLFAAEVTERSSVSRGARDRETQTAWVAALGQGYVTGHTLTPTEGDALFARAMSFTEDLGGDRDEFRTDLVGSKIVSLPWREDHHLAGLAAWTRVRGHDVPDDRLVLGGLPWDGPRGFNGAVAGTDRLSTRLEYGFPYWREINWDPEMYGLYLKDLRGNVFWDTGGIGKRVNTWDDILDHQSAGTTLQMDQFLFQKFPARLELRVVRRISEHDGWNLEFGVGAGF
ncbi:MAG: PD40 domain-containing protein [Planctomycetes bacterium]|nr:PD40 domain-containing protein [Planctomycetota bacterium]